MLKIPFALKEWMLKNFSSGFNIQRYQRWKCIFGVAIWRIWAWRNEDIFREGVVRRKSLFVEVTVKTDEILHGNSINLDDSTRESRKEILISCLTKLARVGVVVRDCCGNWVVGFAMNIGSCSITEAERGIEDFRCWKLKLIVAVLLIWFKVRDIVVKSHYLHDMESPSGLVWSMDS
ncbi:conserved hypothetical protein [Ricinus communis]|uniref:Reverse transcriptase zinc-binding domain-containing protein n=1 Tax=Ricinus communis TaxID=3988 RepID=B9SVG0_RICCO|nr:conserved hypothetical protein [Ricinus communis]